MTPPDLLHLPERAIEAFEKLTGLALVVHDLEGTLWPYLQPERFRHRSPCCAAIKATHDWACVDFEVARLRQEILRHPEGRCHMCHAGLVEWVVPVMRADRLAWILFAGQRTSAVPFREMVRDARSTRAPYSARFRPRGITEESATDILEMLRQLRSRLNAWSREMAETSRGLGASARKEGGDPPVSRRLQIQRFIHDQYRSEVSVADLAMALGLSESRAMHLTREIFGCSFLKLLHDTRLRTAASLLRETSMPILEVCAGSGFQDVSHFHRVFRRRFGQTPLRYRRTASS